MPKDLGLNPTGPLPLGWHRVRWTDKVHGEQHIHTDSIAAAALILSALNGSTLPVPDTPMMESWSDYPTGIRST